MTSNDKTHSSTAETPFLGAARVLPGHLHSMLERVAVWKICNCSGHFVINYMIIIRLTYIAKGIDVPT
jgi:hypothetical protein